MGKGIFYAVSVGAGDPLDMTLRAKQELEQADVVVAPVTKQGSASAAYTIAAQAADLSRAQILEMLFPMKAHTDYRERLRSGILQPVCAALDEGKLVAMVTLGDVSVYSTASYVRQLLEEKGYETRVAAGVPSFCAGAAKAKQSLCENGETLGILPGVASREVLEQAFDEFDNLVIMKAGRALSWLLPLLEERGLLEHTTMLRDVGMASEYVGSPQAEPYSYFTTLLIRQRGE